MPAKPYKRDYIARDTLGGPASKGTQNVTVSNNPSQGSPSDATKPADAVNRIADGKGRNKRGN